MLDRVSIDRKYKELPGEIALIDKIKNKNIETFKYNIDIFMLAFDLGIKDGHRTPLKNKMGFVRDNSIGDSELYCMKAAILPDLIEEGMEKEINNTDEIYKIIEEYANTGFSILDKIISEIDGCEEDTFIYKLIEIMDEEISNIDL
ncbi:hypothetical protein EXD82_03145 [Peptacetobacter hominis]|uniref:Dnd system-associated protein 4 n=1 Tax=Peptacetobacter hominis TaxID=2743610 RepID=A0A544QWN1_9FIRM|nr:hypothetical protein [Peptacetobacter hominis]TQQ85106.1 hypothetical protein EXD82_03145 [Peptacetobacter hominis]